MAETTATANAEAALEQARQTLAVVAADHAEAAVASDAARAALGELEAAADRGEHVDVKAYTEARAAVSLASRRTAALTKVLAAAERDVTAAQEAVDAAGIRALAADVPDPSKARMKALRAVEEYLNAVRARQEAVDGVHKAGRALPLIPHRPELLGITDAPTTGWPAWTTRSADGAVTLGRRIGPLLIDGEQIARPEVATELERLLDDARQLA